MPKGRPHGSKSRLKTALLQRLAEKFPEYDPVIEMAKTANDEDATWEQRFAANKEVAKYCVPQLKAVEVTGLDGGPIGLVIDMRRRPDAKPDDQG